MEITYLGHSSFRLKGKIATIVTDPFDASVGFKFPKIDASIVTVSHSHGDHNNASAIACDPKIVNGPGEYEIKGVSILGIHSYHDNKQGVERGTNTIYVITLDNINICHLGDLGHKLSEDQVGEIGNVDILLIPVGGVYSLNPSVASEIVSELEPKIVIPMHYQADGLDQVVFKDLEPVGNFIKELGVEPVRDNKFVITYDKIPEEMQLVVLERKS